MSSWKRLSVYLFLALFGVAGVSAAQTFRGGIAGRVADSTGAVLPGVTITATNDATGVSRTTTTSAGGDFSVPDLQLGTYTVEATLQGFQTLRTKVEVTVSQIASVDLKMGLSQVAETINVTATALTLDTVSTALSNVVRPKQVQDLPLNGRDFTRMLQLAPGVAGTSVNGVRTRGNNFQIDGADNNDAFQNVAAVNQGGVSGIAGTLLPIEAIDQFSVQSGGQAEMGRNAGSTVNLVIKSGTNDFHGSAFYFNRHEALSANSPVALPGAPKRPIRNNQYGFSLGGPIVHSKTFFFSTLEVQKLTAGNTIPTTAPSDAWVASATQLLNQFNVPVNPVSTNMLALWPGRSGAAIAQNFVSTDANTYSSANGIAKIDHNFNSVHSLSARYFGGGGDQVATTNSPYLAYFQAVPSRMHNVSLVGTSVLSSHVVNQLVVGYNYFKQTFNSNDFSANPLAMGFNTGVTDPDLAGPPNVTINGFAAVGGTQPLGRVDKTLHFTDSMSYAVGSHQMKFGGEARMADLFVFYDSNKRGTFTYDGTVGPWASLPTTQASASLKSLADFMAGSYATGIIVRGNTHHDYVQNSFDLFFQDAWAASPKLTFNFGARYTYPGVLGASDGNLTNFLPSQGMVSTDSLYPAQKDAISPRIGITYVPTDSRKTVIRGGYGLFYDMFAVAFFTANTGFANGGALGVGNNPGGDQPVFSVTQRRLTVANNVPIFGTAPQPPYGAFAVSQDLKLSYVENFNVNVEQQLGATTIAQIGYVGTRGHRLALMRDINAATPGPTLSQARRPYATQYPDLAAINELESTGRSTYNSLQMSLIQSAWHGLSGRLNYTLAHAMDNGSEARNTLPMIQTNIDADWGNAAFDIRHVFTAGFTYNLPAWGTGRFGDGWQINTIATFQSGTPFTITTGTDISGTGVRSDRPNLVGDPYAGVVQPTTTPLSLQWFNPAAFAAPAAGTFGNLARNALYGPGFKTVDASLFKTTKLTGNASVQLRLEVFNLFNTINWANPGAVLGTSTTFGVITNTRNANNAPGIGAGEPRNVQLAVKFIF
ncbi:MAG: carboxypeptidase regulatory-like domain-containing protein [Vicinamibacterales bacterium]